MVVYLPTFIPEEDEEMPEPEFTGFSSPKESDASPKACLHSLTARLGSPKTEFRTPRADLESPVAAFDSPKAGFHREGIESPNEEFHTTRAGLNSTNTGLVSPSSSFGSPNAFTFGSPQAKGNAGGNVRRSVSVSDQESPGRVTRAAGAKVGEESPEMPDIGLYNCTCRGRIPCYLLYTRGTATTTNVTTINRVFD